MARLLGFSSKVLQSSQSRNLEAFLAGNSPSGGKNTFKVTSIQQRNICYQKKIITKAELPTLAELSVLSLVHVPGLTVQPLQFQKIKSTNFVKLFNEKHQRTRNQSWDTAATSDLHALLFNRVQFLALGQ